MAQWPAFAEIVMAGHRAQTAPGHDRTPFADGHIEQKKIYSRIRHVAAVTTLLSADNKTAFEQWVRDDIGDGADAFDMNLPGGAAVRAQIIGGEIAYLVRDPRGEKKWEARMSIEYWADGNSG